MCDVRDLAAETDGLDTVALRADEALRRYGQAFEDELADLVTDDDWNSLPDGDFRLEHADSLRQAFHDAMTIASEEIARLRKRAQSLEALATVYHEPHVTTPWGDELSAVLEDTTLNATDYVVKHRLHPNPGVSSNRVQCVHLVSRCGALMSLSNEPEMSLQSVSAHADEADLVRSQSSREVPSHYTSSPIETVDKVNAVVDGLPADKAWLMGNVIKYVDRAGKKLDAADDLSKAHDYAHRLVFGDWDQC